MSMSLNFKSLEYASEALKKLSQKIQAEKEQGSERLKQEYTKLVQKVASKNGVTIASENEMLAHPIMQQDVVEEGIPGNIRKADHFMPVLKKLIVYFKKMMQEKTI